MGSKQACSATLTCTVSCGENSELAKMQSIPSLLTAVLLSSATAFGDDHGDSKSAKGEDHPDFLMDSNMNVDMIEYLQCSTCSKWFGSPTRRATRRWRGRRRVCFNDLSELLMELRVQCKTVHIGFHFHRAFATPPMSATSGAA